MKIKNKNNKDLYTLAKLIIPGGTTLFSKRSELHLPDKWPAYFSKSKKIKFRSQVSLNISAKLRYRFI